MSDSLKFILAIQAAMLIATLLDIPIARQIVGFVYVSFIPGFLFLRILRLNPKSRINTILFSVGLSVAFLMFVGLAINELYPLMGVSEPLSILPLSVTIGTLLLVMSLFSYKRDDLRRSFPIPSISQIVRGILLLGVPFLAILGASLTNSLILLLMVVAVAALVIVTVFSRKLIPSETYPIVIMVIAVSLLFQIQFISKHLLGWDVFSEFYVFRLTSTNSLWNHAISSPMTELLNYNAMLSVTILPTIYSNLLNIQGEWIFKFVYLGLYSLVPLSMYQMYKQEFGKPIAFLSAFYFILFPRFLWEERRQIIGELFFVLLIFSILNRDMNPRKRQILLTIFGVALVVSHYSLSYIFMFCVLFTWAFLSIMSKLSPTKWNLGKRNVISISFVVSILIFNLFWYAFVSTSPGRSFLDFIGHIATSLTSGFFALETRGETVSEFVAPSFSDMSVAYKVDYVINKIPYFLIIIGFILFIKKYKKMNIQLEYLPLVLANISILAMVLVVPFFAPAFLVDRFYHVSLLFLAPVCVSGGETFLKWILKPFLNIKSARSVCLCTLCIFFVVIFLFKAGFVYEVTGDVPISRSISFTRMKTSHDSKIKAGLYEPYVPEQDIYSAMWLSDMAGNSSKIYADETASKHVLRAYGMKIVEWEYFLYSHTTIEPNAYVYLRYLNVHGLLREHLILLLNITEISYQLNWTNKIYSNGDSEVYRSLPSD